SVLQDRLQVDRVRRDAVHRRRGHEDLLALQLEPGAEGHLGLHVGEAREHGLDVLPADRAVLVEDDLEQAAGRLELLAHWVEQPAHEALLFWWSLVDGASSLPPIAVYSWDARPRPPPATRLCASVCGSIWR